MKYIYNLLIKLRWFRWFNVIYAIYTWDLWFISTTFDLSWFVALIPDLCCDSSDLLFLVRDSRKCRTLRMYSWEVDFGSWLKWNSEYFYQDARHGKRSCEALASLFGSSKPRCPIFHSIIDTHTIRIWRPIRIPSRFSTGNHFNTHASALIIQGMQFW